MQKNWEEISFRELKDIVDFHQFDGLKINDLEALLRRCDLASQNPNLETAIKRFKQVISAELESQRHQLASVERHREIVEIERRKADNLDEITASLAHNKAEARFAKRMAWAGLWLALLALTVGFIALCRDYFDWHPRSNQSAAHDVGTAASASQTLPVQAQPVISATEPTILPATNPLPTVAVTSNAAVTNLPSASAPITNAVPVDPPVTNQP